MPSRILFVDDEHGIRLTLPEILKNHGFDVTATGSVAEALGAIGSTKFDVLVADLNIGEPGDGFTVVSAMRRTQPACVNFILTGYPAFETALQAIRSQVDDYLVKPAEIQSLVELIELKLKNPRAPDTFHVKSIAEVMRENLKVISTKVLKSMKSHSELSTIRLPDAERVDHVPGLVHAMADQLDSSQTESLNKKQLRDAAEHGRARHQQGYSLPMLIEDTALLDAAIFEVIQDNLLAINVSNLVPNLRRVNRSLESQLKESIKAFLAAEEKAA